MALNAGTAIVGGGGTGLSQEMADNLLSALGSLGIPPGSLVAEQQVDDLCNAIASAVIDHFKANAEVTQPIGPLDGALQVSTTVGAPTAVNPALPTEGVPLSLKGSVA